MASASSAHAQASGQTSARSGAAHAPDVLLATLGAHGLPTDDPRLQKALSMAASLYGTDTLRLGMPMLQHTMDVLQVLLPFQPDTETVCACLLQHALKTRKIGLPELEEEFGVSVRSMVSGVHLLSHVTMQSRKSSIEDLRLMLLSVSDDVRVLLIILCERCAVLEKLRSQNTQDSRRIARDVLTLFAPVAARLGIHALKQRMEALAFPMVYPLDAGWINDQVLAIHARHGEFLDATAAKLATALHEHSIRASVQGREKQAYSIFRKLRQKTVSSIEHLPDLFALRVIVETPEDCYRVLGLLHRMARPAANRFKDYIAFPKPNGYQSLHTTITRLPGLPEGVFVEVQVRTVGMHREAEYGIAAHWSYKEHGSAERSIQSVQLQQVLTAQQPVSGRPGAGTGAGFADHLFVLTPKGDIVELPEGATPLDFAFQIHTNLGLSFRAARVNGSIVPLEYELENGDVIEILSHRTPKPSPEWMQLLKMASSRTRLRRYLHSIDRDHYVDRGQKLLNAELRKRKLPPLDADLSLLRRYQGNKLTKEEREDLLMKIGQGSDRVSALFMHADALHDLAASVDAVRDQQRARDLLKRKVQTRIRASRIPIDLPIATADGVPMPLKFAKCCDPLEGPHEDIRGYINRAGSVMVHKARCRMIKKANPERGIGVKWVK